MFRLLSSGLAASLAGAVFALTLVPPAPAGADDHRDEPQRQNLLVRAASSGKANAFVAAAAVADLLGPLQKDGALTVLVPTDEAFGKLPAAARQALFSPGGAEKLQALLKYHILPGRVPARQIAGESRPKTLGGERLTVAANDRGIAINNATVVEADVLARNGVIHFIDAVLQPPAPDLLGVAEKAGQFGVLLEALDATGLDDTLRRDGPFTVFGPTDEAFQSLGTGTLRNLLDKSNRSKLKEVLKFHVVAGRVSARDAVGAGEAKTLQGGVVPVSIKGGKLTIGGATALATDLEAGNGVIHVIDRILVPEAKK